MNPSLELRPRSSHRTAAWTLVVLTALNFLNYVDRYVLAAVLPVLAREPPFAQIGAARLGLLQAAFLVVHVVFSPLCGALSSRIPRRYIIAVAAIVWSAATVASGFARTFNELLLARALVGFGEAGYAAVAPAILNDLFAPALRARVLAIFYTAIYAGSALGFVVGGTVAQAYGWRASFYVAGGPGLLVALAVLTLREAPRGAFDNPGEPQPGPKSSGIAGVFRLLGDPRIALNNLGQALLTFTLGGLAFWAPTYFVRVHGLSAGGAGTVFGGMTVVSGIVGTFAGGFIGDAWIKRDRGAYFKLSGIGLLIAAPLLAIGCATPTLTSALGFFFMAQLFCFLNAGPLNAGLLSAAPVRQRELAMGLNVLLIHAFGDAWSPALIGGLSDHLAAAGVPAVTALARSLGFTSLPLLFGGVVLLYGARYFRKS